MTDHRLLFKTDTGDLFTLNATGALVYRLYANGAAPQEIARRLASQYHITPAQALDDVHAFLAQVRVHGFGFTP